MQHNLRGAILALVAMGIFATHDAVVKSLGANYSPFQILFFGALFSFPPVAVIMVKDSREASLRPRHLSWVLLRTVLTVVTGVSAFYAFATLPLAQVYVILFASPLLITILAIPLLGERVRVRRWAAVIVGLIGVIIVIRPGQAEFSLGHLAALTAAVCGATASVIVRKIGSDERSVVLLLFPMVGNFIVTGLALPFVYHPMPVGDLGLMAVIAGLGLVASFLVILSYRAGEAAIVAPMQYSQILWATGYGYLLFDEGLDGATVLGAGIIIASGLYIVFRETRSGASAHQPVTEARGRAETPTTPKSNLLQRLSGRQGGAVSSPR
ncbi:MAG: DMT family transporter [Albidovulum sp.]